MASVSTPEDLYELLHHGEPPKRSRSTRVGVAKFLWNHPLIITTLITGAITAGSCFAFTYWLSKQSFQCPSWALRCTISDNVGLFARHLNQVQGVVGALFSVATAMMAYALYQLAETTLWPALAKNSFTLSNIDYYLATTRGSLPSAPFALANARELGHATVLVLVTLIGFLQLTNSVVVGHAYSLANLTTTYYSNHSSGGGLGIPFSQSNPPGVLSGAVGEAVSTYNSWANELSVEPLPEYRQYLFDRANMSGIGNFSAKAIRADLSMNCSGRPIHITETLTDRFYVSVNQLGWTDVLLRIQPKLTVWVDQYKRMSNTSAITTLMFLAMDGNLEKGHENGQRWGYANISSLACDVNVQLKDDSICTYTDIADCKRPTAVLSELSTLSAAGAPYRVAVYMAAAVSVFGVPVYGAQPVYNDPSQLQSTTSTNGSSVGLPFAWTTAWSGGAPQQYHYTIDELDNFVRVGAGALSINMMRHFPAGSSILASTLPMQRLESARTWILLMPPAVILGTILLVGILSASMYKASHIPNVRLGTTSEVVISSQTKDINSIVREARTASSSTTLFSRLRVRYGVVAEGFDGLARKESVTAFSDHRSEAIS